MAGFEDSTEAWTKVWVDAQKQYLDSWMQIAKEAKDWPGSQPPFSWSGAVPWSEPLQQWTRWMTQALPKSSQDTSTRLFDLGKSFLSLGETFWRLLQEGKDIAGYETKWQEAMKNALATASGCFDLTGQGADPWTGFATFWGLPLNTWQRFACSFSPLPGELEKALRPETAAPMSELTKAVRQMLSMPALGYTREWQEQAQEWTQLALEYTKAMQDFGRLLGKVSQRAAEIYSQKLGDQLKEGKPPEGLRAAYNLWVDCGEEAYAEVVATPEFPHLQAEMVNALMRLKRHEQLMMDEVMTALNMPTRRELDTTHKRVYVLQQELRSLQNAVENIAPGEPEVPQAVASPPAAGEARARNKPAAKVARSQPKRRAQAKKKG